MVTCKPCIRCGETKPLSAFYKNKGMKKDGHLNKCIPCVKLYEKERLQKLMQDSDWVEKERERSREKYHKLGYKDKHKPTREQKREIMKRYKEKYPEKERAKMIAQRVTKKGKHAHHWSYNEEDAKDVILLSEKDHNLLHRFLTYDQDHFKYRGPAGHLLSKEDHLEILKLAKDGYTNKQIMEKRSLSKIES